MKILIAYDGSENADHAIAVTGRLFPGAAVEVIHAWEPVAYAAARAAVYVPDFSDDPNVVDREQQQAEAVLDRGIEGARAAGLDASGEAIRSRGPLWNALVEQITARQPDLTVMGTRGLTGIRNTLAGSVSRAVVSHSHAPVLTIPLEADE